MWFTINNNIYVICCGMMNYLIYYISNSLYIFFYMKLLFNKANKNLIILYNILHRHTYNLQDNVSILKMFDLTLESD